MSFSNLDGLILVHKPPQLTSHDVVEKIRKILHIKKVGHFGSLDPLATGLLLIAVGKATRLFQFFLNKDKVYTGEIKLGYSTDTYDSLGKPISSKALTFPEREEIVKAIKKFTGEIQQFPPRFSAKKHKGKPYYALARENKEVILKPIQVFVHDYRLKNYNPPLITFEVRCSTGTYIRSLAHDLGQVLGCGAHLSQLERTRIGDYHLENSLYLEEIENLVQKNKITDFLYPLETLLPEYPKIILNANGANIVKNGNIILPDKIHKICNVQNAASDMKFNEEIIYRMFDLEGRLLAFAKKSQEKNGLHPFLVIEPHRSAS